MKFQYMINQKIGEDFADFGVRVANEIQAMAVKIVGFSMVEGYAIITYEGIE